ncbi:MAG: DNA-binding protein [Candidatus Marinimicrobia bacterium]|nr:DNA-binding protein [Candidatus Neomarinimicrobiota bacterium]
MQYIQDGDTYIIHVQQDEPIMSTLTQFCKDNDIINGEISGIGAIRKIKLGAYDLVNKEYIIKHFNEIWELTSFQANIQLKDGEPFIHAHINMSDHKLDVKGGHLFEAEVAAVGEFVLRKINTRGKREMDETIGLATMCFID